MSLRERLQILNQKPKQTQLKRYASNVSLHSYSHVTINLIDASEIQQVKGQSIIRQKSLNGLQQAKKIQKPQINIEKFIKNSKLKRGLWKNLKFNINKENQMDNAEKTKAESNKDKQAQFSTKEQKKFEKFNSGKKNQGKSFKKTSLLPKYSLMTPPKLENSMEDSVEKRNTNERQVFGTKIWKKTFQYSNKQPFDKQKLDNFQIQEVSYEGDQTLDHIFVASEQSYQNSYEIKDSRQADMKYQVSMLTQNPICPANQKPTAYLPFKCIKETRRLIESHIQLNIYDSICFQSPKAILNSRVNLQCRFAQSAQVNQNEESK